MHCAETRGNLLSGCMLCAPLLLRGFFPARASLDCESVLRPGKRAGKVEADLQLGGPAPVKPGE